MLGIFIIFSPFNIALGETEANYTAPYQLLFPKPFSGWQAGPITKTATDKETALLEAYREVRLSRTYKDLNSSAIVQINIYVKDLFAESLIKVVNNKDDNSGFNKIFKPYNFSTYQGILSRSSKNNLWNIKLLVGDDIIVGLKGKNLSHMKALKAYLQKMNLEKIASILEK